MRLLLLTLCFTALAAISHITHALQVAEKSLALFDAQRERPVRVHVWYPAAECAQDTMCLAPEAKVAVPVVFSHGAMGSPLEYSWLSQALAAEGFIVVGIAHFGESWVYGADTVKPENVPQFWLRTGDVSFALDTLTRDNPFNRNVNWNNTTGIGHSSGGHTMAALAGARFSTTQTLDYCQTTKELDRGCGYGDSVKAGPGFETAFAGDYHDKRMTRWIALDPALGPAATVESLKQVTAPALIIGAKNNDFLPFNAHSARYAKYLPKAQLQALTGNEGHFVFLNPCNHNYQAQGVSLCTDAEGVNRVGTHKRLVKHVLRFLNTADTN